MLTILTKSLAPFWKRFCIYIKNFISAILKEILHVNRVFIVGPLSYSIQKKKKKYVGLTLKTKLKVEVNM